MAMDGIKRVGFMKVPDQFTDDVAIDIDDTFTLTIDDGAVVIV